MTNSLKNKSKFHEEFINNYNEGSNIGYSLEVDVQYPEKLHEVHVDFQFLSGRMEIGKIKQHLAKVYDKKKIFFTHENFKTNTESWISIAKSAKNHQIQSRSLIKIIHSYEYRAKQKRQKSFLKSFWS